MLDSIGISVRIRYYTIDPAVQSRALGGLGQDLAKDPAVQTLSRDIE